MNITLIRGKYSSNLNCPIAKGLRRRGIVAIIGPTRWDGLLFGFIPVSGPISRELNDLAMFTTNKTRARIQIKLGWRKYKSWLD